MPRDRERIAAVLNELERAWRDNADMRLAQIVTVACSRSDPFYVEDDELIEGLKKRFPAEK